MLIKSEHKDYYDHGLANGVDTTLVFARYPKHLNYKEVQEKMQQSLPECNVSDLDPVYLRSVVVGFCGKIYPIIQLAATNHTGSGRINLDTTINFGNLITCTKIGQVDRFFEGLPECEIRDRYLKKPSKAKFLRYTSTEHFSLRGRISSFFDECRAKSDKYLSWFHEYKTPIFVKANDKSIRRNYLGETINEPRFTINAILKEFEFVRYFYPISTFQEISMFLGSIASPEDNIPEMSDEIMVEIKGFDPEYGFRKRPKK